MKQYVVDAFTDKDLLCILELEEDVRNLNPDLGKVKTLDGLLLHATAPGNVYDCVSHFSISAG